MRDGKRFLFVYSSWSYLCPRQSSVIDCSQLVTKHLRLLSNIGYAIILAEIVVAAKD